MERAQAIAIAAAIAVIVGLGAFYLAHTPPLPKPREPASAEALPPDLPAPPISASEAHSPTVSLVRYVTVGTAKAITGPDSAGYWKLMVSVTSTADAPIDDVSVDCTFFDAEGTPMGTAGNVFHNVPPGQAQWDDVSIQDSRTPHTVQCRPAVAFNLN